MKLKAIVTTALATLASSTNALSTLQVSNFCDEDVYLTVAGEGPTFGPVVLATATAWLSNITGKGNTATITKTNDIFSAETAKLILGTSVSDAILYWSVGSATGDPFVDEAFSVTSDGMSPNICQSATTYDGDVHACQDVGVSLLLTLCPFNR